MKFESSDTSIATVDADGFVTEMLLSKYGVESNQRADIIIERINANFNEG